MICVIIIHAPLIHLSAPMAGVSGWACYQALTDYHGEKTARNTCLQVHNTTHHYSWSAKYKKMQFSAAILPHLFT